MEEQWSRLTYNDVTGIDRDIETLIGRLRATHGYTREKASAEIIRKLSFAA